MATTLVASSLDVSFGDASTKRYKLAYHPFFETGDSVPDGRGRTVLASGYVDIRDQPIFDRSVPGKERQFFSESPDGTSLLALPNPSVPGLKGKAVFAVAVRVHAARPVPAPVACFLRLSQCSRSTRIRRPARSRS